MGQEWLQAGETVQGSWPVFVGEQGPSGAKTTGRLHVTEENVYFESGISLEAGAAAALSMGNRAFVQSDKVLRIAIGQIDEIKILKKWLFLKSLQLRVQSGEQFVFHFGAMSPLAACSAIEARGSVKRQP